MTEHRRPLLPLLLAALCLPAVLAAVTDPCTAPASQSDASVTSFDDTVIAVTVFRPDGACAGDPRPVILTLHGWSGSRSTDAGASDVAPFLADGYGVVAIDARGHGDSGGAALVHHPDREVRDFRAVLDFIADELAWVARDDTGIPKDVVAGAYGGSYGGGFQLMTAAFDDRLDALVPMATWNDLQQSLWPNRMAIKSDWLTLLYAAGEANASLDPALGTWFRDGMANNLPPHAAQDSFRGSSPATWMAGIDVPTLLVQGLPDTLFNLNEAVHNLEGIRANGADVRLIGVNTGHLLPGVQPTALGHDVRAEDSPCGDLGPVVSDFLASHLRGDATAAARLAEVPRVMLATEQDTCVSGPAWPLHDETIDITTSAILAPEPAGSTLVPLLTAEAPLTLAGIPQLTGTPVVELDDQLYLSLVVVDGDGVHVVDDQVTGMRLRAPACHAARAGAAATTRWAAACAVMATPRRIELGGIATTLQPGQELYLRVDGWNEQSALNSTRRPGAAVLTNVTIELPVVDTPEEES
ncbi:MAG: CocE/NonD family hydrolase [Actinobacteria bacterium]|nr:CocE/NonD family hydrolase [Actinomycetota bacterium]